jgi:tRNA (guanine-N7-)-methyltransferase
MAKKKLIRFSQMEDFPNVKQVLIKEVLQQNHPIKGKWKSEIFNNNNPITIELGCGKGEYSVALAKKYPNRNFIGVDIKGARIWYGASQALNEKISNVHFLRSRIDFIDSFFDSDEVDEIWITFPDPQPNSTRERKRLSSDLFVRRYLQFLKPGGTIHLKTDNFPFYDYSLKQFEKFGFEILFKTADLYGESIALLDEETREILSVKTHYEGIFSAKGFKINYCKAKHTALK